MGRKTHGPYLIAAIEHNDLHKVNEILQTEIRSKPKIQEFLVTDVKRLASEFSEVPLLLAACNDDPTIIKHMVTKFGANINHVHEEGFSRKKKKKTALIEAVRRGLYPTVEAILALNADSGIQDHKGRTALHHAVRKADYRMAKILCSKGAQVNISDKANNSPLHMATIFGHVELVKVLVKYGGDLYRKGQHGAIPIHIAAREGHATIVRLYCQFEVNVNIKVPCYDEKEKAPIHVAAEEGHAETVFALLESCGADVGLRDSEGETPLHCCVINEYDPLGMKNKEDYTETVKVILNYGADTNLQNRRGETPLHLAARNEFQKVVEVLVKAGSDPIIEDYDHNKPIDLVFPDDTVSRQILKNAQEERERFLNEAIEIRAKGFTTSIPTLLPLSMKSQSTMSLGMPASLGTYGRAGSVQGLLMQSPQVPPMFENEYLQPVDHRSNLQDMHMKSVSQANTYKSSNSRSTGSSSSSRNMNQRNLRKYADIEEETTQVSRPSRTRDRRGGSESQPPHEQPLSYDRRAQSADRLNDLEPPMTGRSLPSPPEQRRGQSQPRLDPYNPRQVRDSGQTEATSVWGTSVSTYQDLNDDELTIDRGPPKGTTGPPVKAATITKRQPSPMRFLPVGPHGVDQRPQVNDDVVDDSDDDDDSYFDDESFDTLDDLSEEEKPVQQQRRKPTVIDKALKSGSQVSLHDWLEEQAGLLKERDEDSKVRPVAQSTPPRDRRGRPLQHNGNYDGMTDTASELSEHTPNKMLPPGPPIPPKPVPRDRNAVQVPSRKKPDVAPKPHPKPHQVADQGQTQKVIELEVYDSDDPGQTIIRVKPAVGRKDLPTPPPRPPRQQDTVNAVQDVPDKPKKTKKSKTKKSKGKKTKKAKTNAEENNNEEEPVQEKDVTQKAVNGGLQWLPAGSGGDRTYDSIKHSDLSHDTEDIINQSAGTASSTEQTSPASPTTKKPKKKKGQKNLRQQMFEEDLEKHQEQLEIEKREQDMLIQQEQEKQAETQKQRELQEQLEMEKEKEYARQQERVRQQQLQQQRLQQQQQQVSDDSADYEKSTKRKVTIARQQERPTSHDSDKRTIVFNTEGELKFMLVGGNAEGIYVVHVDPMSDAKTRGLQHGDQIIKVNGRSIKKRTKEEVRHLITSSGSQVALVVKHRKEECDEVMANGGMGDCFFVRALYSHHPEKPGELIVKEGDIFSVKDSLPENGFGFWLAVKVSAKCAEEENAWKPLKATKKGQDEQPGFIPNKSKAEQIITRGRLLDNKPTQRGGLFTKSFGRSKSVDKFNKAKEAERQAAAEANISAYQRVEQVSYQFKRPVIILGLFCDVVRQQLLYDMPDYYVSPDTEVEVPTQHGPVDIRPIKKVMEKNKHCLMIMSPKGIEFIKQHSELNPIVIYLSPGNKNVIKVVKNKLAPDNDRKVNYMFDEAVKFEKQHLSLFTDSVEYTADDTWLPALKDRIRHLQDDPIWQRVNPDTLVESDSDNSSPETRPRNTQQAKMAADRMSKTTDDIPDPIQSLINRHGQREQQGRIDEYGDMASEDYTSDESEAEVDVGMRRPLPHRGGVFQNSQSTHNVQAPRQQPHEYAAPMNQPNMRMRNRSEGDILQYLNSDMDQNTLINSGRAPPGAQYGSQGRYSGDYSHHQHPPMNQRPPQHYQQGVHGNMHPGGVPAYEYMGGRQQYQPQQQQQRQLRPQQQQQQYRPQQRQRMQPMMQTRQTPKGRGFSSETQL